HSPGTARAKSPQIHHLHLGWARRRQPGSTLRIGPGGLRTARIADVAVPESSQMREELPHPVLVVADHSGDARQLTVDQNDGRIAGEVLQARVGAARGGEDETVRDGT